MDLVQEQNCVRRSQAGDRPAFEELVRANARLVWASVYGCLKDPAAFRSWLLTVARRLAWRRAEVAGRSLPPADGPAAPADAEEALGRLPERYRLPLALHFLNGMEYGAIVRTLGVENGSLRGLIARGTKCLRAELAPWWRMTHGHPYPACRSPLRHGIPRRSRRKSWSQSRSGREGHPSG